MSLLSDIFFLVKGCSQQNSHIHLLLATLKQVYNSHRGDAVNGNSHLRNNRRWITATSHHGQTDAESSKHLSKDVFCPIWDSDDSVEGRFAVLTTQSPQLKFSDCSQSECEGISVQNSSPEEHGNGSLEINEDCRSIGLKRSTTITNRWQLSQRFPVEFAS